MKMDLNSKVISTAGSGDLEKLHKLIEKDGADVNATGNLNRTALHTAAMQGKIEIVMYLCEKGANKNTQSNSGETPLHLATMNGHISVVEFLLDEGADFNIKTLSGKLPSELAKKKDMKKLFEDATVGKMPKDSTSSVSVNKQKFTPSNAMVEQLQTAGYSKGIILEAIYKLFELKQDYGNVGLVIKEITALQEKEKEKSEKGEKEVNSETQEDNFCKICFTNVINTVLLPCAHVAICFECTATLKDCPICREKITKVVKTFKS